MDMKSPSTYAEWCDLLDEIENSCVNHSFIETIRLGKALMNDVASKRLYHNVCEMVQRRVNNAQKVFQCRVENAKGSAMVVTMAIKALAVEYQFVYLIVQNLPIMETNKTSLLQAIFDKAEQTQKTLKEIAIRSQNEALVSLIYKCPINLLGEQDIHNSTREDAK